jgi:serine/threonine protein kinase
VQTQVERLSPAPQLAARMEFDGYRIVRELYISSRSHVFLAADLDTGGTIVIKTPSMEMRNDREYLERLLMEEWIARRLDSAFSQVFVGYSISADLAAAGSSNSLHAFSATASGMEFIPRQAEVTQTVPCPNSPAMASQPSPLAFFASTIASTTSSFFIRHSCMLSVYFQ